MDVRITFDTGEWESILRRAPGVIHEEIRAGVEDSSQYLLLQMQVYPPQRRGSSYVRTNTLYRSWHTLMTGTGTIVIGEVVSSGAIAPYNVYVQDAVQQASVHRGRWQTIQMVMERSRQTVFQLVEARFRAAISRLS